MNKPNCYECIWRGGVPGSAHSCCNHPNNTQALNDPLVKLMGIFASVGRVAPMTVESGLNIVGNPHGIKNGWFNWPMNFDPTWLEQCDGFEKKGGEDKDDTKEL